ncbi:TPA: fimbrial protein [Enterobacter kobei]
MKKIAIVIAIGTAFAATGVQAAGNGTINFTGKVVAQTCDAAVNGTANPSSVTLPTVQANVLGTAGSTAGQTSFNIALTNCAATSPTGGSAVKAYFEKGATVDANGRLTNQTTDGAKNVALELVDGNDNSAIKAGDIAQNTGNFVTIASGKATLPYSVRYYATGTATAGAVTSSATYSLIYQ